MKTFIYLILFSSLLFSKVNILLSHSNVKHGSTVAVILQSQTKLNFAPNVIFKNKTYQMFTINGSTKNYEVFLPIDYHNKLQKENVQVVYKYNNKINKKNLNFNVIDGSYKKNEIIKVAKGKVKLNKKNKSKANTEYSVVYKNVYSVINTTNYISKSKFIDPINSKVTSPFGTARIYNSSVKSYHTGTDFRAKVKTKIYSSNTGKVALVMKRFYLGNVVYIDHGRGAYSYYSHMNNIIVKKGDIIKQGQLLGYSGKTGRITGPHLHYAFRLYNVTVDPIQFSSLHNNILKMYH